MSKIGIVPLFAAVVLGAAVVAAPVIRVDNADYEFGEAVEGIAVVHTFRLTNAGDEPLVITRMWVTCPCTIPVLTKAVLAPGESTELKAILDTSGFNGPISKEIYVESNDPATPRLTLRLAGTVNPAQPYHMPVGDLDYLFYLLIDLREEEDYAAGHLLGAIHIPYAELEDWLTRLPRGVFIILYDQDGSLSDLAAQALQEAGLPEARSLLGGLVEWRRRFGDKFFLIPE